MTGLRIPGAVEAIAVLQRFDVEIEDDHAVDIADAELVRKGNLDLGFGRILVEEHKGARCGMARIDREVHASGREGCAEGKWLAGPQFVPLVFVGRENVNALHAVAILLVERSQTGVDALEVIEEI